MELLADARYIESKASRNSFFVSGVRGPRQAALCATTSPRAHTRSGSGTGALSTVTIQVVGMECSSPYSRTAAGRPVRTVPGGNWGTVPVVGVKFRFRVEILSTTTTSLLPALVLERWKMMGSSAGSPGPRYSMLRRKDTVVTVVGERVPRTVLVHVTACSAGSGRREKATRVLGLEERARTWKEWRWRWGKLLLPAAPAARPSSSSRGDLSFWSSGTVMVPAGVVDPKAAWTRMEAEGPMRTMRVEGERNWEAICVR